MIAYTGRFRLKGVPFSGFGYMKGWGNLSFPVADSGEGPGCPPLFLDQKHFFGDRLPIPYQRVWMTTAQPPLPPPPTSPLSQGVDPVLISVCNKAQKANRCIF